jgi:hypothetical protein
MERVITILFLKKKSRVERNSFYEFQTSEYNLTNTYSEGG